MSGRQRDGGSEHERQVLCGGGDQAAVGPPDGNDACPGRPLCFGGGGGGRGGGGAIDGDGGGGDGASCFWKAHCGGGCCCCGGGGGGGGGGGARLGTPLLYGGGARGVAPGPEYLMAQASAAAWVPTVAHCSVVQCWPVADRHVDPAAAACCRCAAACRPAAVRPAAENVPRGVGGGGGGAFAGSECFGGGLYGVVGGVVGVVGAGVGADVRGVGGVGGDVRGVGAGVGDDDDERGWCVGLAATSAGGLLRALSVAGIFWGNTEGEKRGRGGGRGGVGAGHDVAGGGCGGFGRGGWGDGGYSYGMPMIAAVDECCKGAAAAGGGAVGAVGAAAAVAAAAAKQVPV